MEFESCLHISNIVNISFEQMFFSHDKLGISNSTAVTQVGTFLWYFLQKLYLTSIFWAVWLCWQWKLCSQETWKLVNEQKHLCSEIRCVWEKSAHLAVGTLWKTKSGQVYGCVNLQLLCSPANAQLQQISVAIAISHFCPWPKVLRKQNIRP